MRSLSGLPFDVSSRIFSFLDPMDIISLRCTSTSLRELVDNFPERRKPSTNLFMVQEPEHGISFDQLDYADNCFQYPWTTNYFLHESGDQRRYFSVEEVILMTSAFREAVPVATLRIVIDLEEETFYGSILQWMRIGKSVVAESRDHRVPYLDFYFNDEAPHCPRLPAFLVTMANIGFKSIFMRNRVSFVFIQSITSVNIDFLKCSILFLGDENGMTMGIFEQFLEDYTEDRLGVQSFYFEFVVDVMRDGPFEVEDATRLHTEMDNWKKHNNLAETREVDPEGVVRTTLVKNNHQFTWHSEEFDGLALHFWLEGRKSPAWYQKDATATSDLTMAPLVAV